MSSGVGVNWGAVMQGTILAAVLWVGKSVHDLQVQQAAFNVQLAEVTDLKGQVRELQQIANANRQQIALNTRRLDDLEGKR